MFVPVRREHNDRVLQRRGNAIPAWSETGGQIDLDSVGGGARVNFDRFALDAALAVPLSRVGIENKRPSPRFLLSLTTRLWPWSFR